MKAFLGHLVDFVIKLIHLWRTRRDLHKYACKKCVHYTYSGKSMDEACRSCSKVYDRDEGIMPSQFQLRVKAREEVNQNDSKSDSVLDASGNQKE